ncbi:hypothetical protein ACT8ZV_03810 [Nocardioides sp. MAHUQ-72]|uniref:hypothetical protein n=1 Tax=unclassified Nocardioides TaxID=2615069 RepID=UPI003618A4DA
MRKRLASSALLVSALVAATTLTGCSDDDAPADTASGSTPVSGSASSPTPTEEKPYLPVPDGVELTAQGSELAVGDDAVVAYEPRQGTVGVLDVRVTGLEKTSFARSFDGWQLDKATRKTNPYFVRATVENVGRTDLGGRAVPLYIVDGRNTLIEASTFASSFKPCPSTPFPKKFGHGDKVKTCLVYLSPRHGDLTAVSFRPTQEFDPITWTGELTGPGAEQPKKGDQGEKDKKDKKKDEKQQG